MKAPLGLTKKILLQIDREERRRFWAKAVAFGTVLAGSLAVITLGVTNMASDFARSGFFSFTSLFFSDFSMAMANFSDFMFSLIASFPVFSAAIFLAGVFAAVWSAAGFVDEIMFARRHTFVSLSQ